MICFFTKDGEKHVKEYHINWNTLKGYETLAESAYDMLVSAKLHVPSANHANHLLPLPLIPNHVNLLLQYRMVYNGLAYWEKKLMEGQDDTELVRYHVEMILKWQGILDKVTSRVASIKANNTRHRALWDNLGHMLLQAAHVAFELKRIGSPHELHVNDLPNHTAMIDMVMNRQNIAYKPDRRVVARRENGTWFVKDTTGRPNLASKAEESDLITFTPLPANYDGYDGNAMAKSWDNMCESGF